MAEIVPIKPIKPETLKKIQRVQAMLAEVAVMLAEVNDDGVVVSWNFGQDPKGRFALLSFEARPLLDLSRLSS